MSKLLPGLGHLHGAGKWIMVSLTTMAAIIGLLVNARSLGLTPWLGLGGVSLANLEARRVSLAPAHDTLTALGDTVQLAATVTDAHGAIISGATLLWAADDSTVVTVDSSGAVVARGAGAAIVTATVHEHTGSARVTVAQRPTTVVIARDTAVRLPEGGTAQLVARAFDSRRHVVPGSAIGWASQDTAIASITPSGSVSARGPGRTTLTASLGGLSASIPAEVSLAPASVRLVAGDGQRVPAGRRLPVVVAVQVLSRGGKPVPGAAVSFTAADGQGKADPAAATSDRGGRAGAGWTLGPQPGRQHLDVSVAGIDSTVRLTAEADPVPANTRVQAAGEAPRGPVGTALPTPVGIRVTDASGAALADVPVAWRTTDGTVEALAPRTDSLGEAWAHWTLAARAGIQRARAQVGNPRSMAPFTVTATALPGAAAAAVTESGADQDGPVGATLKHPIVVRLTDRDGNVAAGATLRVVALSGSVPETALVADARGRVSLAWTLGRQAGPQALELRVGDGAPLRVGARGHPREPANIAAAGAPRSAPAGRALAKPVVFTVTDAYGNPVPDIQVVFAATSGSLAPSRVMTDPSGRATTRWTLGAQAGDHTLIATVRGTTVRDSMVVRAVKRSGGR